MVIQFILAFKHYLIEILPALGIGFFLSGLIHEFVPAQWVDRHLGGGGVRPVLYSTLVGSLLPICCLGSLPVAVSFYKKGAKLGPVLAFLVATPATSITALLVTYKLLGLNFTAFLFFSVILMGLVMGTVGNLLKWGPKAAAVSIVWDPVCGMSVDGGTPIKTEFAHQTYYFCSSHCRQSFEKNPQSYVKSERNIKERVESLLRFAFVDMVKEIGPEMFLGLILAALVAAIVPIGTLIRLWLGGGLGYLFALVFGLIMYICSTSSVPLVHAFISQGMNIGAGMVLLLVGPITSYGTILVLRKEFGTKILLIYLGIISALSLVLGYSFHLI